MYKFSNIMLPEMFDSSSAELKRHTHIMPVNLQQNIYMWISEVRHEEKVLHL